MGAFKHHRMRAFEHLNKLWKDRWLGLVLGLWMQGCGGISYTFSLYSAALKTRLAYNQESIDGLGTAKDIGGNIGIVSGLLIDIVPAWIILLVGAVLHLFGYGMLWLVSTGRIPEPAYWQMCVYIMTGTNGATWFNTAVLVTCIRNFPHDRGIVVGLLKGFIGLSGAIFTQVYTAVYAPEPGPFLLLCASAPPVVAVLTACTIRPIDVTKERDPQDKPKFIFLYAVGVILAFYLMAVLLVQDFLSVHNSTSRVFMFLMLFILLLPGSLPFCPSRPFSSPAIQPRQSYSPGPSSGSRSRSLSPPGGGRERSRVLEKSKLTIRAVVATDLDEDPAKAHMKEPLLVPTPRTTSIDSPWQRQVQPRLGVDHSLFQALATENYWLLFFAMGCGTGSGLTAINNLAQMAESVGSESVGAFVSLVSVWNFLGRLASGYVSEYFLREFATPRPLFMMMVQLGMGSAHLLFASGMPGLLYLGSALVGMAHGAHWTLMVATASEMFGLKNFGALYNTLSISATVGSYLLSVKLAGYIYDRQVASIQMAAMDTVTAERVAATGRRLLAEGAGSVANKCVGPECFRLTFLIMAGVCAIGSLALGRLVYKTQRLYKDMQVKERVSSRRTGAVAVSLESPRRSRSSAQ